MDFGIEQATMRSPMAINLVLLAGGVSLFGGAAIMANKRQHERDCQEMRNQAIPDINHKCSADPALAGTGHGGSGGGYHYYGSRRSGWFDFSLFGNSRGTYGSGWSQAAYNTTARPSVTRGGFGLFGTRFSVHGFGG